MDAATVETLVDKLAEKIGCAVEQVQPIAQQTLEQYVARETFIAIVCSVAAAIGVCSIIVAAIRAIACRDLNSRGEWPGPRVAVVMIFGFSGFIMTLIGTIEGVKAYARAIAPLPSLLGL